MGTVLFDNDKIQVKRFFGGTERGVMVSIINEEHDYVEMPYGDFEELIDGMVLFQKVCKSTKVPK